MGLCNTWNGGWLQLIWVNLFAACTKNKEQCDSKNGYKVFHGKDIWICLKIVSEIVILITAQNYPDTLVGKIDTSLNLM